MCGDGGQLLSVNARNKATRSLGKCRSSAATHPFTDAIRRHTYNGIKVFKEKRVWFGANATQCVSSRENHWTGPFVCPAGGQ